MVEYRVTENIKTLSNLAEHFVIMEVKTHSAS